MVSLWQLISKQVGKGSMLTLSILDCPEPAQSPFRRPFINLTLHSITLLLILPGPFLAIGAISFYIFVAISVKSFSDLPVIGRVAVIFFFAIRVITLNLIIYGDALCIVATAVYVCAKQSIGNFSTLDYIFIVLSLIGHIGVTVMTLLYKYLLGPRLHEEWLKSFDPEWSPKTDLKWTRRMNKLNHLIWGFDDD
jgi:hypothetical protein